MVTQNVLLPKPCDAAVFIGSLAASEQSHVISSTPRPVIYLCNSPGKRGQHAFLSTILPLSVNFIEDNLARGRTILIACPEGSDASLGVVIAALQSFFDEEGVYIGAAESQSGMSIEDLLKIYSQHFPNDFARNHNSYKVKYQEEAGIDPDAEARSKSFSDDLEASQ